MHHTNVVKASEVCGVDVKNNIKENIGEINELVLDKRSGKVAYAVLDFGGFLGFGNKFFAIPWTALSYDANEACFIMDINKEKLKNAPGFDKEQWPDFSDASYTGSIDRYYQSH